MEKQLLTALKIANYYIGQEAKRIGYIIISDNENDLTFSDVKKLEEDMHKLSEDSYIIHALSAELEQRIASRN